MLPIHAYSFDQASSLVAPVFHAEVGLTPEMELERLQQFDLSSYQLQQRAVLGVQKFRASEDLTSSMLSFLGCRDIAAYSALDRDSVWQVTQSQEHVVCLRSFMQKQTLPAAFNKRVFTERFDLRIQAAKEALESQEITSASRQVIIKRALAEALYELGEMDPQLGDMKHLVRAQLAWQNAKDNEALLYFGFAAGVKNAYATYNLGVAYEHGLCGLSKDAAEALRLYQEAASLGNAAAQFNLGVMHAQGRGGLAKSDQQAVALYTQAANQGHAAAQFNLGVMHEQGRGGLAKSDQQAVALYTQAANQGHADAQFNLGLMHAQGRGGLAKSKE